MLYLTQADDIRLLINQIADAKILWLDTETADWWTSKPRVSLIQVLADHTDVTGDKAYILDVLDKPELVTYFVNTIMVNPNIKKIFHNASYDVNFLGREQVQNVTCTWKIAKDLKKISTEIAQLPNLKLKTLAEELCNFSNVDQEEGTSDWGRRPLTEKQLKYAKMDTVYLAQVHRRLLELTTPIKVEPVNNIANSKHRSFSVTKVRVAFECPRLFYLGHRFGGKMMFLPDSNTSKVGTQFHQLADHFAFIAKQEPRFSALFEPAVEQLNVEVIAQQLQQLFYKLSFFPHIKASIKTNPAKAPALYQLWEGLKGLIRRWVELLVANRRYCTASDVINKTLIDIKPNIKYNFQLPNGTQQLVQGRFDSLIYDFAQHRLCIVEYKTYQSPDKSAQLAQVALYSYMLKEKLGVYIDSAVYSVLPNWDEITFTWDELEQTVHQLIPQKLQQMSQWVNWEQHQINPPPPTSQPDLLCNICPQKKKCQSFFIVASEQSTPTQTPNNSSVSSQTATSKNVESPVKLPTPDAEALGKQLVEILQSFKIGVDYLGAVVGSAFIRVKLKPNPGVRFVSILNRTEDLKVHLEIANPPLIATQAGYISVDLPRLDRQIANFEEYIKHESLSPTAPVKIAIGIDLEGKLVEADLSDPNTCHFLVGGTTGSGKSEFLRSLLLSLIIRHPPEKVQIALVDPKRVTFPEFEQMRWLYAPVVKDRDRAIELMEQLVVEMDKRYKYFEAARCADLITYNQQASQVLPRIVCIFDEYADFMAEKDSRDALEQSIKRLGAMARAAGIHLIVATQRPEAKVVTPIIRSNLPGRVALRTASEADSKIILGGTQTAAAYLLGKGDLLYQVGAGLHRLQSLFFQSLNFNL